MIKNEKGEINYISAVIFVLIAVITLMLIIDVLSVVSTKQKIDIAADRMARQIELSGKVDAETDTLLDYLTVDVGNVESVTYSVDSEFITKAGCDKAIQLGTPFYVEVTSTMKLGDIVGFIGIPITLTSRSCGVSERYWK